MDQKRQGGLFFLVGGMIIFFLIVARPTTFQKMNHLEGKVVVTNCIVHLKGKDYPKKIPKTISIHQEQFMEIMNLMSEFRYCKVWGKRENNMLNKREPLIDIEYLVEGEKLFRRIFFTTDGYIYIDDELLPYQEINGHTENIIVRLEDYLEGIIE